MVLDNFTGLKRPDPKVYSVVTLEDGTMNVKHEFTLGEACKVFESLNGSGIPTVITRTSEILKNNV